MTVLNVKIDDDIAARLNQLAKSSNRSKSSYITEMLELYLEDYEDGISALERLNDKDAKYLTLEEAKKELGL